MDSSARMTFSYPQFCQLARLFHISLKSLFIPPSPPVYYGQVRSREDDELVCLLWRDEARDEWVAFAPDEATEEVEKLFKL